MQLQFTKNLRYGWRRGIDRFRSWALPTRIGVVGSIVGIVGVLGWNVLPILWTLFPPPDEVSSLPHILYEYESNYPQHFLRLKQPPPGELQSKLILHNRSHYLLENLEISSYILFDTANFMKFRRPYELNASDYLLIGSHKFTKFDPGEKIPIDILAVLLKLFKSHEALAQILLPELGKGQTLPRLNPNSFSKNKPSQIFTNNTRLLTEEFEPLVPGQSVYGYGFHGAMLKLIVQYTINELVFKHLLIGGLYYKYGVATLIPVPYKEVAIAVAVSGFYKADNSLWSTKGRDTYSYLKKPQPVIDKVEQGIFTSNVDGPVRPGEEITLRIEPHLAFKSEKGPMLPLPMYLYVENITGKPQK